MAWLTGYGYRAKGSVVATAAGAQTNFQMKLLVGESSGAGGANVQCDEHCQNFPNDIRFTGADGETKHDYWVQGVSGTTPNRLATVLIEVATIPASGYVDVYMYYGKAGDSGESNGANTFVLYDVSGIAGFWHMDEASWDGTPSEVEDETGVNDGTANGGLTTTSNGKFNRCGDFDGGNDFINCGSNASLNIKNALSIEAWIKTNTKAARQIIVLKYVAIDNSLYNLQILETTGKVQFQVRDSSSNNPSIVGDTDVTDNAWHHLVGVRDIATDRLRLYVDGSEDATAVEDTAGAVDTAGVIMSISDGFFTNIFNGYIDELRVYNTPVTQTLVTVLFNNYMEKMGTHYNVRKWASPDPTWGAWVTEVSVARTRCYAYIIG